MPERGGPMQAEHGATGRWVAHPVLARLLRVAIVVVPFLTAMVVAFVLSAQLPVAQSLAASLIRWLGIVVVSTLAMMGADRLARRLLPLSALLKLTLVFPDQAPSRFNVAMRTGTTAQLKKRIENARDVPLDETPQQAAERLLELVGLLSQHDRLTRGHSERVRAYTHLIGEELGLTGSELDKLRWAGLLHDIGKIAVDTDILNKPGKLTDDEYEKIQAHPEHGRALVGSLGPWLGESIRAVWEHHERFDGQGYPQGLPGVDISFAARVVTVADAYDVMTSARSYKKPMPATAARAELAACSGAQFDPVVVRAFLSLSLGRLRFMNGPLAWFAQLALFEPSGVVHAGGSASGSLGSSTGTTAMAGGSATAATGAGTAAAASTVSVASTVAATAVSVVASTAGMVVATPESIYDDAPTAAVAFLDQSVVDVAEPVETVLRLDADAATIDVDESTGSPAVDRQDAQATAEADDPGSSSTVASTDGPATEPSTSTAPVTTTRPGATAPPSTGTPTTNGDAPPASPSPVAGTRPTTVAPSVTVAPPVTPPPATLPPRTTAPPTTAPPVPPTTVASPTTPAPPPTVPPGPVLGGERQWYLGSATADSSALDHHAIVPTRPPDMSLPNLDTDRDEAPGVLVQKDASGIDTTDLTKVVVFRGQVARPRTISGDVHIDMYVAPKDFNRSTIHLEAGLFACSTADGCVLVGRDSHRVRNADDFRKARLHLHDVELNLAPGQWIEVRAAVLDDSQDDAWLAFGVDDYDSRIQFPDDDAGDEPDDDD